MAGDHAYLADLRNLWQRNFVAAILTARLNHERIPPETAAVAQRMNGAFQADRDINSAVESGMGSLGIFGGGGGGSGSSYDPDEYMFNAAMGMIAAHRGNPPASPALRSNAARALRGELDPLSLLELSSPQLAGTGLLRGALAMAGEVAPLLGKMALFMAALAVPANEIPSLVSGAAGHSVRTRSGQATYAASAGSYAGSRTSTLAIVSAVLGVASWVGFSLLASIPAIITGHMARREIGDGNGEVEGGGLAMLGLIAGYLNAVVSIVFFGAILSLFGLM